MSGCIYCKSNSIQELSALESLSYKGNEINVLVSYSLCSACENEYISTEQILANDSNVREAKKAFDGLMSSKEIYQARQVLGITQEEAAKIFGGGKNAFSKYERAEVSQSTSMDKLIKIALKYTHVFLDLVNDEKLILKKEPKKSKPVETRVLIARNSKLVDTSENWVGSLMSDSNPVVSANDDLYPTAARYVSVRKNNLRLCVYE